MKKTISGEKRWIRGGSAFIIASTSAPASSALLLQSCAKLAVIAFVSCLLSAFPYRGSRRVETFLLMSLHVSAEIQAFCLASRGFGFGTALRRAAKSVS